MTSRKIGFLGFGNLAQSMCRAFIDSGKLDAKDIFASNRTQKKLERLEQEFGINSVGTNEELVEKSDWIFLCVKPQDLYEAVEPIASTFTEDKMVLSLAAGISLQQLQRLVPETKLISRVMPNTAARVCQSITAYAVSPAAKVFSHAIEDLLHSLGPVLQVEDGEPMEGALVAGSSGIGFLFELMIYWQEWLEERGFARAESRLITQQVFAGAAELAKATPDTSLEELQRKVTSTKGVTAAGLNSMRELEIERALRISFEKAAIRDKELGLQWQQRKHTQ